MVVVVNVVKAATHICGSWLLNHAAANVRVTARRSNVRNVVVLDRWVRIVVLKFARFARIQGSSSGSIFVLRVLKLISLIAGSLLQTLPLLIVDRAASISWHDWRLLADVRVLNLVVILRSLCVISRTLRINSALVDIGAETEKLEMLSILVWGLLKAALRNLVMRTIVAILMHHVFVGVTHVLGRLV